MATYSCGQYRTNPTGREALFRKAANGNAYAYAFLCTVFEAADVADDIEDEKPEAGRVARLLLLMVAMAANPFFRTNADGLAAILNGAVRSWDWSNNDGDKFYAAQLEQVVFHVAMLCGGAELARRVMAEWLTASRG